MKKKTTPSAQTNSREHRIAATMRAISQDSRWDVHVHLTQTTNKRESPLHHFDEATLTIEAGTHQRGTSDYYALIKRWHSASIHKRYQPENPQALQLFDALEEERIALKGRSLLKGLAYNIDALWLNKRLQQQEQEQEQEHSVMALETLLRVLTRKHAQNMRASTQRWCASIEKHYPQNQLKNIADRITSLVAVIDSQEHYALQAIELIELLFKQEQVTPEKESLPENKNQRKDQPQNKNPENENHEQKKEKTLTPSLPPRTQRATLGPTTRRTPCQRR